MPVTAKLSKAFYDRLGEQIVNELVELLNQVDQTYRNELREQNDLNFARFEAKLGERLADSRAEMEVRLGTLRSEVLDAVRDTKVSMVRWMFGFWIGTAGLIIASRLAQ